MSLPSGYTKLEYIQSTGTQYIDTGFIPNQDTRIDITAVPMSSEDANTGVGFIPYGAAESYNSNAFECFSQAGQLEFNYDGQVQYTQTVEVGETYNIIQAKEVFLAQIVGGPSISWSFTYQAFTCPYTLTLFAIHRSSVFCGQQKIYSCVIQDNGTVVRDYIPCKNAAGKIGMYDQANGKFYANSGIGEFTAGPEVSAPDGHSVLIGGTAYSILGGRTLIGGTGYGISKGRTLIGGTGYDIAFGAAETETETWVLIAAPSLPSSTVSYKLYDTYGITFESNGTTFGTIMLTASTIAYQTTGGLYTTAYQKSISGGGGGTVEMSLPAKEVSPSAVITSGWKNTAYRTVTFSQPITEDMFNGNLLSWLRSNGSVSL